VFDPKYHEAEDNETPQQIAKRYDLPLKSLVDTNKRRLEGLQSWSRLEEGTQVQVRPCEERRDKRRQLV